MKAILISTLFSFSSLAMPMEEPKFLIREPGPQLAGLNARAAGVRIGAAVAATTTAPAPATTSGSSDGSANYINPIMYQHNIHRVNHSVANLAWDAGLASTAQKIAASCYYGHNVTVDGKSLSSLSWSTSTAISSGRGQYLDSLTNIYRRWVRTEHRSWFHAWSSACNDHEWNVQR